MKSNKKVGLVMVMSIMLAACSTMPAKKNNAKPPVTRVNQTTNVSSTNEVNSIADKYVENKRLATQSIVISSTKNSCVDGFNFLKGLNQGQFSAYSTDYNKINQNYNFLSINKEIMDKDAKELLSMTLNKKLDTLCAKVQYAGFIGVKDKIKALSDI